MGREPTRCQRHRLGSPRGASPAPGTAHRPVGGGARRPPRDAPRRPPRPGGRGRSRAWRRAVADPAAVAPARRRSRGGDGVCAGVRFLQPAVAGRRCSSAVRPTTPGTPTGWSGPCWPPSTPASASPGARPWPRTSATATTGHDAELRRNRRYSVASRLAPPVRVVRRPATDARHRLARGPRHRRRRRPPRRRPGVAARAVAPAAGSRGRRRRRTSGTRRRSRPCATGGAGLDLPPRLSLFGHTRLPATEVELLGGARRVPRRAPLPPAGLAGAVGRARRR